MKRDLNGQIMAVFLMALDCFVVKGHHAAQVTTIAVFARTRLGIMTGRGLSLSTVGEIDIA